MEARRSDAIKEIGTWLLGIGLRIPKDNLEEIMGSIEIMSVNDTADRDVILDLLALHLGMDAVPSFQEDPFRRDIYWHLFYRKAGEKGYLDKSASLPSRWMLGFTERELNLIANFRTYVNDEPAGLPGHNLMLIIAKLSECAE